MWFKLKHVDKHNLLIWLLTSLNLLFLQLLNWLLKEVVLALYLFLMLQTLGLLIQVMPIIWLVVIHLDPLTSSLIKSVKFANGTPMSIIELRNISLSLTSLCLLFYSYQISLIIFSKISKIIKNLDYSIIYTILLCVSGKSNEYEDFHW